MDKELTTKSKIQTLEKYAGMQAPFPGGSSTKNPQEKSRANCESLLGKGSHGKEKMFRKGEKGGGTVQSVSQMRKYERTVEIHNPQEGGLRRAPS